MLTLIAALLIGIVTGLRAMTAPAIVSWAAWLGVLPLQDTPLAFLGWRFTPWIFTVLALAELVTDQLPGTPSRKRPAPFGTRLLVGAFCGAAVGLPAGFGVFGLALGLVGAWLGTLGGAAARRAMASRWGKDWPAALIEDGVAIVPGLLVLGALA